MKRPEYTIAVISDILGISAQTIRMYEQNGIVCSNKNQENGYRYFNRTHLNVLTWARAYRSLGFSMKDTARLLNECDVDEALACYAQRGEDMEREMELFRLRQRLLAERAQTIREAKEHLGEISIRQSPACYVCHLMDRDEVTADRQEKACVRKWSQNMPFAWPVAVLREERKSDSVPGESLRMIRAEHVRVLGLQMEPPVRYIPPRRCVHTFFMRKGETERSFHHNLVGTFEEMHAKGLQVAGDILVEPLIILKKTSEHILYAQAFIPIDDETDA